MTDIDKYKPVSFPPGTVLLAPHDLEGRLIPGPNGTMGLGLQFHDNTLGDFFLGLSVDQAETVVHWILELMRMPLQDFIALRDKVHETNRGDAHG
ncbi:hypothetical protein [Mycolicibacterium fortuitum]|uniref:hypothetical protein n=1 Tax=Mycolicibacterium fortuitum TaxID=1766 RepID=UPI00096E875F|nr:hypothetical protein [Mycolicibacterium fortuitum]OMC09094.1 hypothetical protein A5734_27835 [Mycolicibacterium fortuitum]